MKIIENRGRLYSSITLSEIPKEYKKLKLLGRGTTSIVYEHPSDKDKVLIFTKDSIKKDWLTLNWGLGKAKVVDVISSKYNPMFPELKDYSIYIIEAPRYYPLSEQNKKKVKKLVNSYMDFYYSLDIKTRQDKNLLLKYLKDEIDYFDLDFATKKSYKKFIEFLYNYGNRAQIDFNIKNFLQDKDGELVFIDPVVDKNIIDIYYNYLERKRY